MARFPRTWKRGMQQELQILQAKAAYEQRVRERDLESGSDTEARPPVYETTAAEADADPNMPRPPPRTFVYTPQAYTAYS